MKLQTRKLDEEEIKYLQQLALYKEPFTLMQFLNDFYPCHDIWIRKQPFISLLLEDYIEVVDGAGKHEITHHGKDFLKTAKPYYLNDREWELLKELYTIKQFTKKQAFEQFKKAGETHPDFTRMFQHFLQQKVIEIANAGTMGAEEPGYIDYILTDKGKIAIGKHPFWP